MPSTIEQAKETILKHGGRASKHQIARDLKISLDYTGLICGELKRKGELAFLDGFYLLTSVKKGVIQDKEQKKTAIPSKKVYRKSKRLKGAKKTKKSRIEKRAPHPLSSILRISESLARTLKKAGYTTLESLADVPISILMESAKLELKEAAQLINRAREKISR